MIRTFTRDSYVVVIDCTGERPEVTYGSGDPHRLYNDAHANDVAQTLIFAGYTESVLTPHEVNAREHGFTPHSFAYGRETRTCNVCGMREAHWDDEENPINPCEGS